MLNDRLRATRMARKHTIQEVADRLCIATRSYQKYESGESQPPLSSLVILADFFEVPTDFLLGRDEYLASLGITVDIPLDAPPRRPNGRP